MPYRNRPHRKCLINQMVYMYTFVVTNMDSSPEYLIKFYCKRGRMENFIKESKSGFDFASVSSHARIVNANRLQVHALASVSYTHLDVYKRQSLFCEDRLWQNDFSNSRSRITAWVARFLLKRSWRTVPVAHYLTNVSVCFIQLSKSCGESVLLSYKSRAEQERGGH